MKFDILNRWSGEVQFTAEIDCAPDALSSIKMGLAIRCAVKEAANLRGANLSGANLRGADLRGANLRGANLYGANLYGANLYGANLRGANLRGADLYGANLSGADLRGANLYGANLYGANLSGADLYGANLYGANLYGANLYGQPIIDGGLRSDGYRFMLTNFEQDGLLVIAGCRRFSPADARRHWMETRAAEQLGAESLAIVDHMVALAKIRGWKMSAEVA